MVETNYWLVKSEPGAYSFSDLQAEEEQTAEWDGVRNYQARNNVQKMKVGDRVLYYHSNAKPNAIVGTAVVVKEAYPDNTAWDLTSEHPDPKSTPDNPIWFMVDLKADIELSREVSLQEVKDTPELQDMVLVNNSRLSVQPVKKTEWEIVVEMGTSG